MRKQGLYVLLVAMSLLGGCASGPVYQLNAEEKSRYADVPTETLVNNTRAKLVQAREAQLDYYGPGNFAQAEKALTEATKLHKDNGDRQKIVQYIASADKALGLAHWAKDNALKRLAGVLELDARLKEIGAPAAHPKEYSALEARIKGLLAALEKGDDATVEKERPRVTGELEALKIRITKQSALAAVQKMLETLRKEKLAEVAPKSVGEAESRFARAEAFIQTNPDNADGIDRAAQEALIEAQHAQWIAARVKRLLATKERPPLEDLILEEERRLAAVAGALDARQMRDRALEEQADALAAHARQLIEELTGAKGRLAETESLAKVLQAQLDKHQTTAGQESARVAQLTSEKQLLEEKVVLLENNVGVLKNQLALLQEILFAKTGEKVNPANTAAEAQAPASAAQPVAPAARQAPAAAAPVVPAPAAESAPAPAAQEPAEAAAPGPLTAVQ